MNPGNIILPIFLFKTLFTALCAKGPFGTCPRPPGYFNYVILISLKTSVFWLEVLLFGTEYGCYFNYVILIMLF
jgi:hypothetical protein